MSLVGFANKYKNQIEQIQLVLCWSMFVGFNYSRALLSISIVLLFVLSLIANPIGQSLKKYSTDKFSIICALYFLSILIAGLWSSNTNSWMESVLNALPFIALPFSFNLLPLHNKFTKPLTIGIVLIMSSGIIYSLINYFLEIKRFGWWSHHFESVPAMPHDYIRHSIGVGIVVLLVYFAIANTKYFNWNVWQKWTLWVGGILGFVYIHLQIAKTGLLTFYVCLGIILLFRFFNIKSKIVKYSSLVLGLIALFVIVNTNIFKQAVATFNREISLIDQVTSENYVTTNSYLPRIVSFSYALEIIKENPMIGVGIGDVKDAMTNKYAQHLPDLHKQYVLIPHNQYLYNAVGLGIPLSIITLLMLLFGFSYNSKSLENICAVALSVSFILLCLIEAVLVVQMSIFVFLFFALFFKTMSKSKKDIIAGVAQKRQ